MTSRPIRTQIAGEQRRPLSCASPRQTSMPSAKIVARARSMQDPAAAGRVGGPAMGRPSAQRRRRRGTGRRARRALPVHDRAGEVRAHLRERARAAVGDAHEDAGVLRGRVAESSEPPRREPLGAARSASAPSCRSAAARRPMTAIARSPPPARRRAEREKLRQLAPGDVVVLVPADRGSPAPARRGIGSSSWSLQHVGDVVRTRERRRRPELHQVGPHLARTAVGHDHEDLRLAPSRRRRRHSLTALPRRACARSPRSVVKASACEGQTVAHIGRLPALVRS